MKTALTTLHELAVLPYLTTPSNLVDRRCKYHSQASHLVRAHQSSAGTPITGLDTEGITPELLLIDLTEPGS
jgi:hypothetical protein